MTENPELRAKILDWQKRYNIQDGDPAMAFLELIEFVGYATPASARSSDGEERPPVVATAQISSESVAEAMKAGFLPLIERMSFQAQEMNQKLEQIDFDKFVQQITTYHEGIDYCTKKLDVVKKETDALIIRVDKAASHIRPITTGAVITLMAASAILGAIVTKLWF